MKKLDGGPAFPNVAWIEEGHYPLYIPGLTKREWFAGLAPTDELCIPETIEGCAKFLGIDPAEYEANKHYPEVAARCRYIWADAMLRAAAKGGPDAER